jgi:hypothetical protein
LADFSASFNPVEKWLECPIPGISDALPSKATGVLTIIKPAVFVAAAATTREILSSSVIAEPVVLKPIEAKRSHRRGSPKIKPTQAGRFGRKLIRNT